MAMKRILRMCVLPSLVTLVVLHGQKRLVSAEQPSAVDREAPPQRSPELSLTTTAAKASVGSAAGKSGRRAAGGADVIINEIRIDQPGSDIDEYFELAGAPGTSLDGLTYLVIGDGPGGSRQAMGASVEFFSDPALFAEALDAAGKIFKVAEDFEEAEADLGANQVLGFDDPLDANTNNAAYQPGDIADNVLFQSNTNGTPENDPGLTPNNPTGVLGMVVGTTGFFGLANTMVAPNAFVDSLDIEDVSGTENHTAMGIDLVGLFIPGNPQPTTFEVRVFDKGENLLGMTTVTLTADDPPTAFLGILTPDTTIGRVNIWDPLGGDGTGGEGMYDIALYLAPPEGCGNDICEEGEDSCNCPQDCPLADPSCGDGICCGGQGETCESCEEDCGACPFCGDGNVDPGEECEEPFIFLCKSGELCDENCQCPGGPENDDCEDRIEIFDGVTSIDTSDATTDGNETSGLGDCDTFGDPQIHNDIWFNYTATCDGQLTVSTCDTVDYNSKIAIYDECNTDLCPRGGDEIGCNDDGDGCAGFSSIATADVVQDSCYKIRIGGSSDADAGTGTVEISCVTPTCGEFGCEEGEDTCNCPVDCGPETCGNGTCCDAQGEDCNTCPTDCGPCLCEKDIDCDDGNPCTDDFCDPETNTCINIPECFTDANCDDGDDDTADTCNDDGCCENSLDDEPVGGECCSGGTVTGGDPIYLFSGENFESVTDLLIPGRGLNFSWARKYRSKIGPNTAQGNGWDYSYNIRLEQDGGDFVLFDGNTRQDTYRPQGDGTWTAPEFFRVLTEDDDGGYVLTFPDTSTWNFHAFGHPEAPGKISSSVDRNGNTINFDYDGLGRLVTIHDTLDTDAHNRDITISYNADGFIESVTDFAEREVRYEYYQDGDAGGSFGDLKSVTTLVVENTPEFPIPTGHDYPDGKTTVYTYSKDFADERLNHNLLTITDPKGQTYLTTVYAETEDPGDFSFDRVVRQIWGDPGDIIDFVYIPLVPSEDNDPDIQVIVNDRVGNVTEYLFTAQNVNVRQREYTGRWDADQPTLPEDLDKPTTPKLRDDDDPDPDFFETRWEYNDDALTTHVIYPNLNEKILTYDPGNASRRSQGNLKKECRMPGPLGGDQELEICEQFEYDDGFGGCCGTNFITRHVDGRGHETLHEFDEFGNRTHTTHRIRSIVEDFDFNEFGQMISHTHPTNGPNGSGCRRVDVFTYYTKDDGAQNGYLKQQIVDAQTQDSCACNQDPLPCHFELTTTFEYNIVGQVVRTIDPRGHDSESIINQLDQVVRTISREVTEGGGVRYERDTFYDPNDNVVRVDIQNKDDAGVLQPNTHFTEVYEYEILNYRTRTCREAGDYSGAIPGTQQVPLCTGLPERDFISMEYAYDANRNRTLTRYGEAANGHDPDNVIQTIYDERDLVFKMIRAPGAETASTAQTDYDGNRNVKRSIQGLEAGESPSYPGDAPHETRYSYDGYDRLWAQGDDPAILDSMGNEMIYHYDENSNRTGERTKGELIDDLGGAGNIRLSQTMFFFDAMDRLIRTEAEFFDTDTQVPIEIPGVPTPGKSTTVTEFSDNSQVTRTVNDNNHHTDTAYDTANRRRVLTDQLNNTMTYTYDANSNVVAMLEVEKSDLGNPDEEFTTTSAFDGLDRLIQIRDNLGNTEEGAESNTMVYGYDSRNNQTVMTDARDRVTRDVYDGINRLIKTVRDTNDDGANAASIPGDGDPDIVTTQAWDDTSRLAEQTDDSNNTTAYTYDALNRMTAETYADTTVHAYTFDVHDNKLTTEDANGSVTDSTFDLLNRLTHKDITPGPDVSDDTTFEDYKYDGLSRLVSAQDDDSLVTRSYDSLSRVTSETLNGQTTTSVYDGVGNKLLCTYPGERVITAEYDALERTTEKHSDRPDDDRSVVATYEYVGPGRVTRREYGNGTRTDFKYDGITGTASPENDFGVKRIRGTTHIKIIGGAIIDDRTFAYDRMYNKVQRADLRAGGPQLTHDYDYDFIYRLTRTIVTDKGANVVRDTNYDLDGVGNRTQVTGAPDPGPHVGPYMMDPAMPPADFQMNQYTTTSADARLYDKNGNLVRIDDGLPTQRDIKYDYRNQMVEYLVIATGQRHTYAYDALGRRIVKVVDADGLGPDSPAETRYFYDGWQVVEEQDAAGARQADYVYGLYIDEVLTMNRGGSDFYYHTDDLYNVMALTDAGGDVAERYDYEDYGQPIFLTCPWDIDGDGVVGAADLAQLLGNWGSPGCNGVQPCPPDFNFDGDVDAADLAQLLGHWGPCPQPVGNPYLFTGRRWDAETGWYYYRTRYLDAAAGRFTTRDTIGIWGDTSALGSGYVYVFSPWTLVDPSGAHTVLFSGTIMDKDRWYQLFWAEDDQIGDFEIRINFAVTNCEIGEVSLGKKIGGAKPPKINWCQKRDSTQGDPVSCFCHGTRHKTHCKDITVYFTVSGANKSIVEERGGPVRIAGKTLAIPKRRESFVEPGGTRTATASFTICPTDCAKYELSKASTKKPTTGASEIGGQQVYFKDLTIKRK